MPGAGKTGLMGLRIPKPRAARRGKQTTNKTLKKLRTPQSFSYEVSHLRGHGNTSRAFSAEL